jgi:excinuclease ABC subunit C
LPEASSPIDVLRKRVAKVPKEPGVYRWLDNEGNVLYVGKAKVLRSRMSSYVQKGAKHSPWTGIMVKQIANFDITVVTSELEAFILESTLIKQLKPKYNIMLKDDKGYVYVRMSMHEKYPSVEVVRRIENDKAKYFGPFMGAKNTYQTLDMLDDILKFRVCKKSIEALNHPTPGNAKVLGTPCLDYQIGKCAGLCIGTLSEAEYRNRISEVEKFFRGNLSIVKKKTLDLMREAAKEQKFEKAAQLRNSLQFIEEMESKQVVSDTSGENADVFGIALSRGKIQVVLLRERDGKVMEQLSFALKGEADNASDALAQFLPQYYLETEDIPDVIILSESIGEAELLETWLRERRGKAVRIVVPERGKKSKLLDMAVRNAEEKVEQQFAAWEAEAQKVESSLAELASLLSLKAPPRRIEGYDISHMGGTATVASMVVFVHGKAKRDHYRSFNMKTVKAGDIDDYKSLAEGLRRRLKYLTDDLKTVTERFAAKGIEIGKARKAEQKKIEEISAAHPNDIGSDGINYEDYIVARKGEEIVGFARLFTYPEKVPVIRSVWVREGTRGNHLGQVIIRTLLKRVTKGKVYVHISKESLVEYYAEIGFQVIDNPPPVIQKKMENWAKDHPGQPPGMVLLYIASKQKADVSFCDHPDLILIDGGKGQLSAAKKVLDDFGLDIPIASLAKREEEIFVPGSPISLAVPSGSQARFLLQRIRDESHRFANAKREKRLDLSMFTSKLDEVPGIGDQTKAALLKKFGSADDVIAANDQDLQIVLSETQLKSLREKFPLK